MKNLSFLIALWFCFIGTISFSQNVGISPSGSAPDASAGLDVNFTDRGLLIPRVSLANTTTASPVTDPAISLLVYNTATTGDVTPGYYFWNGTAWTRLSASLDGSGTANYFPKWTSENTLGSSQVYDDGTNVGIGTATPGAKLEVAGTLKVTDGTQGANKILTSDADGLASWQESELAELASSSNPEVCCQLVGNVSTGNGPGSVAVAGNYAYVTISGDNSLKIYDVGNPANPILTGSVVTGGSPISVVVAGNYAYVANAGSNSMTIYDVSNPAIPLLTGSVYTNMNPSSLAISGNYAYVTSYTSNRFAIYNVSDPANPTYAGDVYTNAPVSVAVSGNYAYVVGGTGMSIFDVSNPASPAMAGGCYTGSNPVSVFISGNYTYTANYGSNNLTIHDVSVPGTPSLVGSVSTGTQPRSVFVSGNYAYVANTGSNTLTIYSVSNPASPTLVGSGNTGTSPVSVFVTGTHAFIANFISSNLQIFQLFCPQSISFQDGNLVMVPETWSTNSVNIYNNNPGNVGIGTMTPEAKLDVLGAVKITDGTQGANKILTSDENGLASWQTLLLPPSGWSMTGNASTVPGTTFIGTTDNVAFDIRTNDILRTRITTRGAIETFNTGNSVFIGEGAGANDDLTNKYNVFIGYQSGNMNINGLMNTAVGNNTLNLNTAGHSNTAVGANALMFNSGSYNTANGMNSLNFNTTGEENSAIGVFALGSNTTGWQNTASGSRALSSNTTGSNNTADGSSALMSNTIGYYNTATGCYSLYSNITGTDNTSNGFQALYSNTSGEQNIGVGSMSLRYNTTGYSNTANGVMALYNNTTGSYNTSHGSWTLMTNTEGYLNSAFGYGADVASGNLNNASAIGAYALAGADNSLVLGSINGINGATASVNVGIGTNTPSVRLDVVGSVKITDGTQGANKILTSDENGLASWQTLLLPPSGWSMTGNAGTVPGTTFIGTTDNVAFDIRTNDTLRIRITTRGAIETFNTGNSVFIGEGAGANDDLEGHMNAFIGFMSGNANTTGYYNTATGGYSLLFNTTGRMNAAHGTNALLLNTTGSENTAVGYNALIYNTIGEANTATGANALNSNSSGNNNTATGNQVLYFNSTGSYNTATGNQAMYFNSTGSYNTAHGSYALNSNTTGYFNVANGTYALLSNTEGSENTASGFGALKNNTTGYANVASGSNSLSLNTTGMFNTASGHSALFSNTFGYQNTANGMNALYANTSGNNNVAEGFNALFNNTTGESNAAVGLYALDMNISGSFNTAVGTFADVASDNLYNATAIGANALAGASNSLVLGSIANVNFATTSVNVGIGTTTPTARLDVVGSVKITDGTQGANKVLTSDANGLASWQTISIPSTGWSLSGNAGTLSGTNFVGTIDNQGIDFRTNNILKTRITTKGAIETYNTGQSLFIGEGAGENDDLNNRMNVFLGYMSGNYNTTGAGNSGIGYQALSGNIDGFFNVAIGKNALFGNTSGFQNTANGGYALYSNSSGDNNTAFGVSSLYYNVDGDENTACGAFALESNVQGRFNSAIGSRADVASANLTNATAIGAQAFVGASNSLVLGSIAGVNTAIASVNVGIGTTAPLERLDVAGGNIRTDQQFISTQASGTAPLSVTSNTLVSNLNADLLDGQHASGFAASTGSAGYIQNQTAADQAAGFRINGNGIFNGGKIGIGTSSPTGNLHIEKTGDVTVVLNADTDNAGGEEDNPRIELRQDGGGVVGAIGLTGSNNALHDGDIQNAFYIVEEYSEGALQFGTNNEIKMTILPTGNIGIGTNSPVEKLDVDGSVRAKFNVVLESNNITPTIAGMRHDGNNLLYVYNDNACNNGVYLAEGGTSWQTFSDIRLKKDFEPVNNILDDFCKLSVTRFHMKTDPDTMEKRLGFIAQEVQPLFPYVVSSDGEYLGLSYTDFGVLSVEAIKELRAEKDAEIAALKNANGELEKKLESLQARIEQIQQYLEMSSQK